MPLGGYRELLVAAKAAAAAAAGDGGSDDEDAEDIDELLLRLPPEADAPSRELFLADGGSSRLCLRLQAFRHAGLLGTAALALVVALAFCRGPATGTSEPASGQAASSLADSRQGAWSLLPSFGGGWSGRSASWVAYEQLSLPGLEGSVVQDDTTEEAAQAVADENGYDAFIFDKATRAAAFVPSLAAAWDVRARGPLPTAALEYQGYWSPKVLYLRRLPVQPCAYPAVQCGMGTSSSSVAFCPPSFCMVNDCCTIVTPFTVEMMKDTRPPAPAPEQPPVPVPSPTPAPPVPPAPPVEPDEPLEPSRRRRRQRGAKRAHDEVESAKLSLEVEPGASRPTKFDVFELGIDFESGLEDEDLEEAQDDVAAAVMELVRNRTVACGDIRGWGDARAALKCAEAEGDIARPCSARVLLTLQGKSNEAMDQARAAVQEVRSLAPAELLASLQAALSKAASHRRLAHGPDRYDQLSKKPVTPSRVSCGAVCAVGAVTAVGTSNAGVFDQYAHYSVYAAALLSAGGLVLLVLMCMMQFSPYQVEVSFTVFIRNFHLQHAWCDGAAACEPLRRRVAREAGVEVDDVLVEPLPSRGNASLDEAQAAEDEGRADMVFEVKGASTSTGHASLQVIVSPASARRTLEARAALLASATLTESLARGLEVMSGSAAVLETGRFGSSVVRGCYFEVVVQHRGGVVLRSLMCDFQASTAQKCSVWLRKGGLGTSPTTTGWARHCFEQISGTGLQEVQVVGAILEPGVHSVFLGASGGGLRAMHRMSQSHDDIVASDGTVSIVSGLSTQEALVPGCRSPETDHVCWVGSLCYSRLDQVSARPREADGCLALPCPVACLVRARLAAGGDAEPLDCTADLRTCAQGADAIVAQPEQLGGVLGADASALELRVDRSESAVALVRRDAQGQPFRSGDVLLLRSAATGLYLGEAGGRFKASAPVPDSSHRFTLQCKGDGGVRAGVPLALHAGRRGDGCLEVRAGRSVRTLTLRDLASPAAMTLPELSGPGLKRAWYGDEAHPWSEQHGQDVLAVLRSSLESDCEPSAIVAAARVGLFGPPRDGCTMQLLVDVEVETASVALGSGSTFNTPLFMASTSAAVLGHRRELRSGDRVCLFAKAGGACNYLSIDDGEAGVATAMLDSCRLLVEKEHIHLESAGPQLLRPLRGSGQLGERLEEYRRSQLILPLLLFGCVGLSAFLGLAGYTTFMQERHACFDIEDRFDRLRCAPKVWEALRQFLLKVLCEAAAPPVVPLSPLVLSALVLLFSLWWHFVGSAEELHEHSPNRQDPVIWRFLAAVKRNDVMCAREDTMVGSQRQVRLLGPRSLLTHPCTGCRALLSLPVRLVRSGCANFREFLQWWRHSFSFRDRLGGLLHALWGMLAALGADVDARQWLTVALGAQCSVSASLMLFLSFASGRGLLPAEFAWNPHKLGLDLLAALCLRRLARLPVRLAPALGAVARHALLAAPGEGVHDTTSARWYFLTYAEALNSVCKELLRGRGEGSSSASLKELDAMASRCRFLGSLAGQSMQWLATYTEACGRPGWGTYVQVALKGELVHRQRGLERAAAELLLQAPEAGQAAVAEEELRRAVAGHESFNHHYCATLLKGQLLEAHHSLLTRGVLKEELERLEQPELQAAALSERFRICSSRLKEIEAQVQEVLRCGVACQVDLAPDEGACTALALLLMNGLAAWTFMHFLLPSVKELCDTYSSIFVSVDNPLRDVVFGAGAVTFLTQLPINHELAMHLFSVFVYEPRWRYDYVRRLRLYSIGEVYGLALGRLRGLRVLGDGRLAHAHDEKHHVEGEVRAGGVPFEDIGGGLVVIAAATGVASWGCHAAGLLVEDAWSHERSPSHSVHWLLQQLRGVAAATALLSLLGGALWRGSLGRCADQDGGAEPSAAASFRANLFQALERLWCGLVLGAAAGVVLGLELGGEEAGDPASRQLPLGLASGVLLGLALGLTGSIVHRSHLIFAALLSAGLLLGGDSGLLVAQKVLLRRASSELVGPTSTRAMASAAFLCIAVAFQLRSRSESQEHMDETEWEVVPSSGYISSRKLDRSWRVVLSDPRLLDGPVVGGSAQPKLRTLAAALSSEHKLPKGSRFTLEQWRACRCSLLELLKRPHAASPLLSAAAAALRLGVAAGVVVGVVTFVFIRRVLAMELSLCLGLAFLACLEVLSQVAGDLVQEPEEGVLPTCQDETFSIELQREGTSRALRWLLAAVDYFLEVDAVLPVEPWHFDDQGEGLGSPAGRREATSPGATRGSRQLVAVSAAAPSKAGSGSSPPRLPRPQRRSPLDTIGEP